MSPSDIESYDSFYFRKLALYPKNVALHYYGMATYLLMCLNISGAEGIRLKEGGHINTSLMVLSKVIAKLSDPNVK